MKRLLALALLALAGCWDASAPEREGLRALYDEPWGDSREVFVSSGGEVNADLGWGQRLIVTGGEAFLVLDRLSGPMVIRVEDLRALLATDRVRVPAATATFIPIGPEIVEGREGRAFTSGPEREREVVIGTAPALAPLGRAMRMATEAEMLLSAFEGQAPPPDLRGSGYDIRGGLLPLLAGGAPLRMQRSTLYTVEAARIDPRLFKLPAPPLRRGELRRWQREKGRRSTGEIPSFNIARALAAHGRLWLLSEHGALWSVAEGAAMPEAHRFQPAALDLCSAQGELVAAAERANGSGWTLYRWRGRWERERAIAALPGEQGVALICGGAEMVFLTSRRLIPVRGEGPTVMLAEPFEGGMGPVNARLLRPYELWIGLDLGEFGGGLFRIDRRSGAVELQDAGRSGHLCAKQATEWCQPITAVVPLPWKPDCLAVSTAMLMSWQGGVYSLCKGRVELLFTRRDRNARDPKKLAAYAAGELGSIPFIGLAAEGSVLIAAGSNGLYRIARDGRVSRRPWPRFVRAGEVLLASGPTGPMAAAERDLDGSALPRLVER